MQFPHLDTFDFPDERAEPPTDRQLKEEHIVFTVLISILERAYLMYHDSSTDVKRKQWAGWRDYTAAFCERANFRRVWALSGDAFDAGFVAYVNGVIAGTSLSSASRPSGTP